MSFVQICLLTGRLSRQAVIGGGLRPLPVIGARAVEIGRYPTTMLFVQGRSADVTVWLHVDEAPSGRELSRSPFVATTATEGECVIIDLNQ